MAKKETTPQSLYESGREFLREQIRTNEILADIAGVDYTPPEGVPKGKYMENKWLLDAAEKKNELLEEIAEGGPGGGSAAAKAIGIDYATDGIFLKNKDGDTIQGSGATLPAYGVTFDSSTGGLTLTKNGTAVQGQTVTIPNYGSPVGVDASADMTDHDKIYLYLGTTGGGLTNGHFYYWDGSAWADGGEYAAATVQTDKTLLVEDRAADAKATGDAVAELKTQLDEVVEAEKDILNILPGESKTATHPAYTINWENGTIDAATGEDSLPSDANNPYRLRTNNIPIGDGIVITPTNGFQYSLRVYDSIGTYLGFARPKNDGTVERESGFASNAFSADSAKILYNTAAYIRIVGRNSSNTQLTPNQNETTATYTKYTADGEPLGNVFAKENELQAALSSYPEECREVKEIKAYSIEWENGSISVYGEDSAPSDPNNPYRLRTDYIPVGIGVVLTPSNGFAYSIRAYDANKNYIDFARPKSNGSVERESGFASNVFYVDSVTDLYNATVFVRVVGKNANNTQITPSDNETTAIYNEYVGNSIPLSEVFIKYDKKPYSANDISLQYAIDMDGHYTKGWLKLPQNYKQKGDAVPLIVFVHGSGDFSTIDSPMTTYYNDYYNYLRDCGYAIFDCFGYGNLFVTGGGNTWGTPTNNRCYKKGIEYVIKKYNIDPERVFVSCKSLGGVQAFSMYHNPAFNIKACGFLAPLLSPIYVTCGYSKAQRHAYMIDTGMLPDTNNVFDVDTVVKNADYIDYMKSNYFVFAGGDPSFIGNNYSLEDKIEQAIVYQNNAFLNGIPTYSLNRPLKIWIAEDDDAVDYDSAKRTIDSLNLAGFHGVLRTMPSGTGGHHSVDNDANAPQKTNVTTRLGITYASVPLAYYELEEFFAQFL